MGINSHGIGEPVATVSDFLTVVFPSGRFTRPFPPVLHRGKSNPVATVSDFLTVVFPSGRFTRPFRPVLHRGKRPRSENH
jgi:hypothetical protein